MTNLRVVPDDPFDPQETDKPGYADDRNFFRVERWHETSERVEKMFGRNRLEKARAIFDEAVKRRLGSRYTIRQSCRVLAKWPDE